MNSFLSRMLGAGEMGLGAYAGNPALMRGGFNRVKNPQGTGFNYWAARNANPQAPSSSPSGTPAPPSMVAPSPAFPAVGTVSGMTNPTIYAPGQKVQMDATNFPNLPSSRRMPDTMYAGNNAFGTE